MESVGILEITDGNFDQEVLKSDQPVMIDFWAAWCGPCKMLAPVVDEVAAAYQGKIKVGKMDVVEASNGTEGLARGTIGWPSYPARTPSTLDFTTKQQPGYWFQPRWKEVWFPDAFAGTMAQLLCALEDGREPEVSGRDNLETVALCEAVFAAAREHRVTTVREFLAEPFAG